MRPVQSVVDMSSSLLGTENASLLGAALLHTGSVAGFAEACVQGEAGMGRATEAGADLVRSDTAPGEGAR